MGFENLSHLKSTQSAMASKHADRNLHASSFLSWRIVPLRWMMQLWHQIGFMCVCVCIYLAVHNLHLRDVPKH